jgi:hypothetical protein
MAALMGFSRLLSTYAAKTARLDAADAAIELTPSDAQAHLIRAAILKAEGRLDEAIKEYEQAIALRPQDYVLWLELGMARDETGDQEGAVTAFNEAVRLAPSYAEPHWQLGNVELRAGRVNEAFAEMRRAAASNPALWPQVIDLAWSVYGGDVTAIEQAVEPQTQSARLTLARFAAKHGKANEAVRIFDTLANVSTDERRTFLTELLAAKQFNAAYDVWSAGLKKDMRNSNAGFIDGGFEEQINLGEDGFGWRVARDGQAVQISIDNVQPHGGSNSLRLNWKGDSNPTAPVVSQLVLVEPNARYQVRFAVRTEELVSAALPLIAVTDAGSNDAKPLAQSKPFPLKTTPWQDYSFEFTTGKETQAVLVSLRRQNCESQPCPIFGRIWLDDFSLQKL